MIFPQCDLNTFITIIIIIIVVVVVIIIIIIIIIIILCLSLSRKVCLQVFRYNESFPTWFQGKYSSIFFFYQQLLKDAISRYLL